MLFFKDFILWKSSRGPQFEKLPVKREGGNIHSQIVFIVFLTSRK